MDLPELSDPKGLPSKFFGGQNVAAVYKEAGKGVNTRFQWSPWSPAVDASFQKQMDLAVGGKQSFAEALDLWQSETAAKAKADGYSIK